MRTTTLMSPSTVITTLCFALAPCIAAQADWTLVNPGSKPSARGNTLFTADAAGLYVFGGDSGSGYLNDLWVYRVNNWIELTKNNAAGSPPARRWGSACYDHGRNELVIFGGQDAASNNFGDTWVYAGGQWTQKSPAASPSPRRWGVMAYDWANNRVLLFGGYGTANMNDTWAWDGNNWIQLSPQTQPPIKSRAGFVSIRKAQEILMYGGTTTTSTATPTTEMWKWNGSDWSAVTQTGGPTSGVEPGMVYDDYREVVVAYGGHNVSPKPDTYEWDGVTWAKRNVTSPGNRSRPSIGYISALRKTVVFGGYTGALPFVDTTHEYMTDKPASFVTSGTGCRSSAGSPVLSASSLPWTGGTLTLEVQPVSATAPVLITLGFSKTQWGAFNLPLSLAPLGAPGCTLYTTPDLLLLATNSAGVGTLSLPIPADPALAGGMFFDQAWVFDASANQLGLAFSNLGEATIGVR